VRRLGISWSNALVVKQSPASMDVNSEAEQTTDLEAVTRRQPVKIQETACCSEL
jgi:hypothetical protein